MGRAGRGRGLRVAGWILGVVGVAAAVGAGLVLRDGYTTAVEAGPAMEPTYTPGDRLFLEKLAEADGGDVRRGDVVAFRMPDAEGGEAVGGSGSWVGSGLQRVVGVGGDRVAFDGTKLTVNGTAVRESYVKGGDPGRGGERYDVKVPPGRVFLLGDNRANSLDSRYFTSEQSGTVSLGAVSARVLDSAAAPVALGVGSLTGVVLGLGGAGCLVAGYVLRGRRTESAWR
ncbi:signal peptidase I [Streptomyces sp. NPDC056672]|uniref:signal peptidase I n=1 Tax=Streptomyces sp. NPDC056672 TaxID=3345906 RepID=UPI0036813E23